MHLLFSYFKLSLISPSNWLLTSQPLPTVQIPRIINLKPNRGPVSGGTIVNITGSHLDAGSNVSVMFKDQPCTYLRLVGEQTTADPTRHTLTVNEKLSKASVCQTADSSQIVFCFFPQEKGNMLVFNYKYLMCYLVMVIVFLMNCKWHFVIVWILGKHMVLFTI